MIPTISTESGLDALRCSAHAFAVISTWSGSGLFDKLAEKGALSAPELSANPRTIEITAPILAHLGLLSGDGERWMLSQSAQRLYASGALQLGSAESNLGDLSRLDQLMLDGGPVKGPDGTPQLTDIGVQAQNPDGAHQFMEFLHRRSGDSAEEVSRWLSPRLQPGARILDLGGGHGRYGNTLASQGFQVTLFDLPVCIEYARGRYGKNLSYTSGDFMQDDLGGPFDGILVSNIVHGLGMDENRQLLKRIKRALSPGGTLLLKDMFLDDSGIGPETAVFFGLLMLLYTRKGRCYSVLEMDALCQQTAFSKIEHIRVPDAGFSLLFSTAL